MDAADLYTQIDLPLASLPVTVLFLLVTLPAAAVLGFWTAAARRRILLAHDRDVDHVVGETTLGAILALLGLLLAFSFSNALGLAQARENALIQEANALGTAFARVDFLPDPGRSELQAALLAYAETRVVPADGAIPDLGAVQQFIRQTLTA